MYSGHCGKSRFWEIGLLGGAGEVRRSWDLLGARRGRPDILSEVNQTPNQPLTEVSWARLFMCVDVLNVLGKVNQTQHQPQTSAQIKPNSAPDRPQIDPASSPKQHRIDPNSSLKRCPNRFYIDPKSTPVRPQIGPTGFPSKDETGRSTGVKRNSVKDGVKFGGEVAHV